FRLACDALGIRESDVILDPKGHNITLRSAKGKDIKIPLDDNNEMIINWKSRWGKELPHYSFIDIIRSYGMIKEGQKPIVDLGLLKDKICMVGLTALGLIDIKPVPIESTYPAVGVNAMVAASLLNNDFVRTTNSLANILIILAVSVFFTFLLSELRPLSGMAVAAFGIIGYFLLSSAIFGIFGLLVITFYPMLAIFLSYIITAAYTQVLQTVERSRLFKQATRDGLTSLYNVRHFNLLLEAEMKSASFDKNRRLSIMMFDIDNFKKLNDTYGHQSGDVVLKDFAKVMQSRCRQTDIVARYGGEEFIIMLPGAGKKEAVEVAEKIRIAFEGRRPKLGNDIVVTTASIGVTEFSGEKTREELVEKADKALYNSKHTGKNKVSVYEPGMEKAPPPPPVSH
nr:diguanylate cyclase [Candidatus Omnitrophota bacterium]